MKDRTLLQSGSIERNRSLTKVIRGVPLIKANVINRNGVSYSETCLKKLSTQQVVFRDLDDKPAGETELVYDEEQKVLLANTAVVKGFIERPHTQKE